MKISVIIEKVHGALAQLGARHTGSVEVTGSSPVCSTYFQAAGEFFSMQKQVYKMCFISGYSLVTLQDIKAFCINFNFSFSVLRSKQ